MAVIKHASETNRVVETSRLVLAILAGVFAMGAFTQVFLAGLSIFAGPGHWSNHATLGHWLGIMGRIIWIPAVLGRPGKAGVIAAITLAVLFELQYAFIEIEEPYVNALHPVNGVLLLVLSLWLAVHATVLAWSSRGNTRGTAEGQE